MALMKSWSVLTYISVRRSIFDTAAWLTRRMRARCTCVMAKASRSSLRGISVRYFAARTRERSRDSGDIFSRSVLKFFAIRIILCYSDSLFWYAIFLFAVQVQVASDAHRT